MATDECIVIEWMYVCNKKIKNLQKEWHPATKPLKKKKKIQSDSKSVSLSHLSCKSCLTLTLLSSQVFLIILSVACISPEPNL
jgi:hypothetical protein